MASDVTQRIGVASAAMAPSQASLTQIANAATRSGPQAQKTQQLQAVKSSGTSDEMSRALHRKVVDQEKSQRESEETNEKPDPESSTRRKLAVA